MTASETLVEWPASAHAPIVPGITMAVAVGDQLSAAHYVLDPAAVVPEHAHDNEEYGQVLHGELRLRHGGRDVVLHPGQGFLIPGGETHSATAGDEGCELLECYAPPRVPTAPGEKS